MTELYAGHTLQYIMVSVTFQKTK